MEGGSKKMEVRTRKTKNMTTLLFWTWHDFWTSTNISGLSNAGNSYTRFRKVVWNS